MERRWERIRIYTNNGTFYGWFSRATGKLDPDPETSTILIEDPGYLDSCLIDPR